MSGDELILALVQNIEESRTRATWNQLEGQRRFQIEALRVGDPHGNPVFCSTLDPWKASACERARETGRQVMLTVRTVTLHGRFGALSKVCNLVDVSAPAEQVAV